MNNVALVGRLTKDVDLKFTNDKKAVANFTIAVDKIVNGEKQANFIPIVVWDKQAENSSKYLRKGYRVGIEGSLQTRSYDNKDGKKIFVMEVLANRVEFLENKQVNQKQEETTQEENDNTQSIEVDDDELPF